MRSNTESTEKELSEKKGHKEQLESKRNEKVSREKVKVRRKKIGLNGLREIKRILGGNREKMSIVTAH